MTPTVRVAVSLLATYLLIANTASAVARAASTGEWHVAWSSWWSGFAWGAVVMGCARSFDPEGRRQAWRDYRKVKGWSS